MTIERAKRDHLNYKVYKCLKKVPILIFLFILFMVGCKKQMVNYDTTINLQIQKETKQIDSTEHELYNLYESSDNSIFAEKLKEYLSDPKTISYPFEKLKEKINIFDFEQDSIRFYSFVLDGGSGSAWQTILQSPDKNKSIVTIEIDIYDEFLYDACRFEFDNTVYYILLSYGRYSSKSWSENIRIATVEDGAVKLHDYFFPDSFKKKTIRKDDYISKIWFLDNNEDEIGLPLNGYIHDNCLTFHNGGSVSAKTINLEFDKENLSFSYDKLVRTDAISVEPSGDRLVFELKTVKNTALKSTIFDI